MKKLLHTIIIILNILLFTNVYFSYCEKDVSDIYNLFGFGKNKISQTVDFSPSLNDQSSENFYNFLQKLCDKYGIDIVYMDMDYSNHDYHLFIQTNANLKEEMNLETNDEYSFKVDGKNSYSNENNLYLLNQNIKVSISPLSMRSKQYSLAASYTFYAKTQENLEKALYELQNKYGNDIAEIMEMHSDEFNLEQELSNSFRLLLLISTLSFILVLFYIISSNQKKIAILKMNGVSSLRCAIHLFAKTFIADLMIAAIVLLMLFIGFVGIVNLKTTPMIQYLIYGFILQAVLFVGVLFVAMIILHFQKLGYLIKGKNFDKILLNGNYIIKVLLLLFLVPMILEKIDYTLERIKTLNYINQNEQLYEEITSIVSFKKTESRINYESTWVFTDPENPILKLYSDVFDRLSENGAVLCNSSQVQLEYEGNKIYWNLEVNDNYLNHHEILDANGRPLHLDTSEDIVYILGEKENIEEIKDNHLSFYIFSKPYKVIEIMPNQNIPGYDLNFNLLDYPRTITVYSDHSLRFDKSFLNSVYLYDFNENKINEILKEFNLDNKLVYTKIVEESNIVKKSIVDSMLLDLLVLAILLTLFIFQMIQFIYLYYKSIQQRIYVKKIMGYSNILIYYPILIESAIAYLIPLAINENKNKMIMLIGAFMIVEWFMCIMFDAFYNRKEIFGRRNKS